MTHRPQTTVGAPDFEAAKAYGRDAWAHGVGIYGARAYSDRLDVQHAWQIGWMAAEDEQRKRSAGYGR